MSRPPILTGCVVISTAGRDENRSFLVLQSIDDEYVFISDGDTHKVEHPKKKKRKHLRLKREPLPEITERLSRGNVQNYEIRKWLSDKEE